MTGMRHQMVTAATGDGRRRAQEGSGLMPGLVIEREIVIEAPAALVWRTITEPDQMTRWFADRVDLVAEPVLMATWGSAIRAGRSS